MCSSTPRVFTPSSRAGSPTRAWLRPRPRPSRCASPRRGAGPAPRRWCRHGSARRSPTAPPGRSAPPRRRQIVLLAERRRRTGRFSAAPEPHQPPHQRDPAEARRVMQHPDPAAVADRDHPAAGQPPPADRTRPSAPAAARSSTSTSRTCMPGTSKIASARAHQRAPEPHIE